jgi:hypothetical protein
MRFLFVAGGKAPVCQKKVKKKRSDVELFGSFLFGKLDHITLPIIGIFEYTTSPPVESNMIITCFAILFLRTIESLRVDV